MPTYSLSKMLMVAVVCTTCWVGEATPCTAAAPKFPTMSVVKASFERQFAARKDYEPGDVISQGDVAPLFAQLLAKGWDIAEGDEILKLVSSDQTFFVVQLRTREGRKFMRKAKGQALVYDRLDRLSRMKGGQKLIASITTIPKGDQLMHAKPTPGLRDLTQLLPKGKNGKTPVDKDFGKPTGLIYTQDVLWEYIKASYDKATASLAAK
jgi:hypothetical protein